MARRPDLARRIAAVQTAVTAAMDAVKASPDSQEAIEKAEELRSLLQHLQGDAAQLRAEIAHRIWTTERLTLTQLAARINVSTGRAGQLVQAGRPDTTEDD